MRRLGGPSGGHGGGGGSGRFAVLQDPFSSCVFIYMVHGISRTLMGWLRAAVWGQEVGRLGAVNAHAALAASGSSALPCLDRLGARDAVSGCQWLPHAQHVLQPTPVAALGI